MILFLFAACYHNASQNNGYNEVYRTERGGTRVEYQNNARQTGVGIGAPRRNGYPYMYGAVPYVYNGVYMAPPILATPYATNGEQVATAWRLQGQFIEQQRMDATASRQQAQYATRQQHELEAKLRSAEARVSGLERSRTTSSEELKKARREKLQAEAELQRLKNCIVQQDGQVFDPSSCGK